MLELRLATGHADALRETLRDLRARGLDRVAACGEGSLAQDAVREARALGFEVAVTPAAAWQAGALPDAQCYLVAETDPATLSERLLQLSDLDSGVVVAPRTPRAFDARPLFLISIPKAGTHLLYGLVEAFGYGAGVVCPEWPRPGNWYCLEYSNSHTRAPDFLVDTVRRSPFGNRHHAFATTPTLFIYRNPLDILVSEAHYYHRDGNTIFGGYLARRSFEERILALIEDPWLFGSLRDRMAGFVPWFEFSNVIPVSFEELVGARGGGEDAAQRRLIWSLQLKLQVPGHPEAFAAKVFDPESATFNAGRIGAHRDQLGERAMKKFLELPQDFMRAFGYTAEGNGRFPLRAEEFRRRPLVTAEEAYRDTPILVETGWHGHNIVRYRGCFYGLLQQGAQKPLGSLSDGELAQLPSATEIAPLKHEIALRSTRMGRLQLKLEALSRLIKPVRRPQDMP